MKAIVQERFGPPDVLRLVDSDLPEVGPTMCWFGCMPPRSTRTTGTLCAVGWAVSTILDSSSAC